MFDVVHIELLDALIEILLVNNICVTFGFLQAA